MIKTETQKYESCLIFKQLSILFGLMAALICPQAFCHESQSSLEWIEKVHQQQNRKLLAQLNPYARVSTRGPANLIPTDYIEPIPMQERGLVQTFLVEDNSGVLESLRSEIRHWQEVDEYAHYWNLESTGLYQTPDDERRKNHVERQFWRYLDRRVSEEINSAEEGSALHTIGRVEDAVRPESSEVNFSEDYRLRFRVRPLRGQAIVELENPYLDHELVLSASGRADMRLSKDIDAINANASFNYHIDRGYAVSHFSKGLAENVTGRISHYTPGRTNSDNDGHEGRIGLYYSKRF